MVTKLSLVGAAGALSKAPAVFFCQRAGITSPPSIAEINRRTVEFFLKYLSPR